MSRKILLVDDSAINLEALTAFLAEDGYALHYATTGERALEVARAATPDLILLDIIMPGIDGYETCRRLKATPDLSQIPVLFLSALDQTSDKVKAFNAGGVDYIGKPFQKDELLARVRTHLDLYHTRRENQRYAAEMEALAQQRAKSLIHADRLATLGTLSAGIAHEVNNPATFISVGIQTIERIWSSIGPLPPGQQEDFARHNMPALISNIKSGVLRIQKIVSALRTYAHAGTCTKGACTITQCIEEALVICNNRVKQTLVVERQFESVPPIAADSQRLEQVFVNLILNAADALEKTSQARLRITVRAQGDFVMIVIEDNGPGISPSAIDRIWDPFFTTKPPDRGTGLGLSITKGIIEDHGGTVTAENRPMGGARFIISLPIKEHSA